MSPQGLRAQTGQVRQCGRLTEQGRSLASTVQELNTGSSHVLSCLLELLVNQEITRKLRPRSYIFTRKQCSFLLSRLSGPCVGNRLQNRTTGTWGPHPGRSVDQRDWMGIRALSQWGVRGLGQPWSLGPKNSLEGDMTSIRSSCFGHCVSDTQLILCWLLTQVGVVQWLALLHCFGSFIPPLTILIAQMALWRVRVLPSSLQVRPEGQTWPESYPVREWVSDTRSQKSVSRGLSRRSHGAYISQWKLLPSEIGFVISPRILICLWLWVVWPGSECGPLYSQLFFDENAAPAGLKDKMPPYGLQMKTNTLQENVGCVDAD